MKKLLLLIVVFLLFACTDDSTNQTDEQSNKQADKNTSLLTDNTGVDTSGNLNEVSTSYDKAQLSFNEMTPFRVLSVSEGIFEQTTALQINFNLPIDKSQDLDQLIRVKKKGQLVKTDWIFSDNQMALYFPFIDANSQYEISISQSLSSNNNQVLTEQTIKYITTQAKKKSARFVSKGNTLLRTDDQLPIESVNVDAVELKFWRIN
ncbi:hypothetical protein MNBD_GAMMA02-1390, partial [hydrothermal vent metagenome]